MSPGIVAAETAWRAENWRIVHRRRAAKLRKRKGALVRFAHFNDNGVSVYRWKT